MDIVKLTAIRDRLQEVVRDERGYAQFVPLEPNELDEALDAVFETLPERGRELNPLNDAHRALYTVCREIITAVDEITGTRQSKLCCAVMAGYEGQPQPPNLLPHEAEHYARKLTAVRA